MIGTASSEWVSRGLRSAVITLILRDLAHERRFGSGRHVADDADAPDRNAQILQERPVEPGRMRPQHQIG